MRVVMVSKACVVGQYQTKLEELAKQPDIELTVVVPPFWRDERGVVPLERAHTHGYTLLVAPIRFNGQFHLHYYPTLSAILERIRPQIVHVDEEPYNLATFLALRAARRVNAKTVFFTWQNLLRRYPPPFSWMESYVLRHADHAIAGNAEAEKVLRAKNYAGKIKVIPQFGIDPEHFAPVKPHTQIPGFSEKPGIYTALQQTAIQLPNQPTTQPFRIGYAGRLVEEKGIQVLLAAIARLNGEWELRLQGSGGPYEARLHALAQKLGIASRVHFTTPIPSVEMPTFYNQLDILVLPSLTRPNWKEQFGRARIEAMACEIPVIGSACGEIPNVIGDAGLVFAEGDAAALRAHLAALRDNPTRRRELGKRGRARVLANFTQAHVATETFQVYSQVVE